MLGSRTLILMRHATAGHQGASTDHGRPLTPEGVREAADAGDWIRHNLPPVDAVLCSTAVRTRQTLTATCGLSPVMTFTTTPNRASRASDSAASALGRSTNTRNPTNSR